MGRAQQYFPMPAEPLSHTGTGDERGITSDDNFSRICMVPEAVTKVNEAGTPAAARLKDALMI